MPQNIIILLRNKEIFQQIILYKSVLKIMPINYGGIQSDVKIITNWRVSIDPSCLNKLGKY